MTRLILPAYPIAKSKQSPGNKRSPRPATDARPGTPTAAAVTTAPD